MTTEVGTLQASLSLDIRSFADGISEAANLAKSLGSSLREALGDSSQGFSSLLKDTASVREEIEKLRSEVKSLNAELNQAGTPEAFTQVQQHTSRLRADLAAATAGADNLSNAATGAETAMSGVGDETQQTVQYIDIVTGEIFESAEAAKEAAAAMRRVADEAQAAAKQTSVTAKETGKTERKTKQTARATREATKAGRTAERQARNISKHMGTTYRFARDVKQIIAGILISQAFYEMLNVMQSLVRGSMKFSNNMDQAQIAFKYLLEDANQAIAMINALQDFAVYSPLDTSQVMDATRKLMAMGFTAKSVIPTLSVLADTAAVFSGEAGEMSDMIAHIVLALGQMRASGKVMMQELRQLYNAGIPVFAILQEELGLTSDQVRNIGKLGIDSGQAVVALLKGLQKRYKGAAEEFTKTIPGALEVIQDSVYILYTMLSQKPHNALKEFANEVAQSFEALTMITRNYGVGGFFQALLPKNLHEPFRRIVGSIIQLSSAFAAAGYIIKDTFINAMLILVHVFSWILPPISTFINAVMQLVKWLYITVPFVKELAAAFVALFVVKLVIMLFAALGRALRIAQLMLWLKNVVISTAKAFIKLAKAVIIATKSNLRLMASLLAVVAILGLILALSGRARTAMKRFADSFKNVGIGFSTDDIMQPEFNPPPVGDFDDGGLQDIITDVEELGDQADKTKKKMDKMLTQSFDEVYTIDDSEDPVSGLADAASMDFLNIIDGLDDIIDKVDTLAMSGDFWEDWGSIEDYFKGMDIGGGLDGLQDDIFDLGDNLWDAVKEAFSAPEWVGAGIGIGLGTLIGGIVGGPMGAKIGGAIGGLTGWLAGLYWEDIVAAFESVGLNEATALSAAIAVPLGAALGFKVGGPIGALVGAGIAALVSWLIGEITEGLDTGDWTGVSKPIGVGLGAAIGFLAGGPIGALAGSAIGLLVGTIADMLIDGFTNDNWDAGGIAIALGTSMGATIGLIMGGPGGALIGAAVGTMVGGIVDLIIDNWDSIKEWFTKARDDLKNFFIGLGKEATKFFTDLWTTATTKLSEVWAIVRDFFQKIWDTIKEKLGGAWSTVSSVFQDIIDTVSERLGALWTTVKEGVGNIYKTFVNWVTNLWDNVFSKLFGWITEGIKKLTEFFRLNKQAEKDKSSGSGSGGGSSARTMSVDIPDAPVGFDVPTGGSGASALKSSTPMSGMPIDGHRDGGIFNKEHVAWISEGNRTEAIVPLQNPGAMQPFVDAVAKGIVESLAPIVAGLNDGGQAQPLYVGTLIADERGLKELERKLYNVRQLESTRR